MKRNIRSEATDLSHLTIHARFLSNAQSAYRDAVSRYPPLKLRWDVLSCWT